MNNINKLPEKKISQELLDKKVYILVGADVVGVLEDMGRTDILGNEEELKILLEFIDNKMEIPWREYVEASIEIYEMRKRLE